MAAVPQSDFSWSRNSAGVSLARRVLWHEDRDDAVAALDDEAEFEGLPIYLDDCEVVSVDPECDEAGYWCVLGYRGLLSSAHRQFRWSRKGSFAQEPIASHPRRADLETYYGGYVDPTDGKFKFPAQLPSLSGRSARNQDVLGLGGSGSSLAAGDANPLYGVESYPSLQADYTLVFADKAYREDLVGEEGRVRATLPKLGKAPPVPRDRNLLVLPIEVEEHGDGFSYQYTVHFRLSPPGKPYPERMFDFITR